MKRYSPQRHRVHRGFVQVAIFLSDFLCALCASAVQTPIPTSHKSLKNLIKRVTLWITTGFHLDTQSDTDHDTRNGQGSLASTACTEADFLGAMRTWVATPTG